MATLLPNLALVITLCLNINLQGNILCHWYWIQENNCKEGPLLRSMTKLWFNIKAKNIYDPYQVNDYISKGADKELYCSDNSQTFTLLIWWHLLHLSFFLIMYNLHPLNWHGWVSQNSYTSKQGFWCSHGFMSLMLNTNCEIKVTIRHVFRKKQTTCEVWITGTYKECDNNRCLAVWRRFLSTILTLVKLWPRATLLFLLFRMAL